MRHASFEEAPRIAIAAGCFLPLYKLLARYYCGVSVASAVRRSAAVVVVVMVICGLR